MSAAPLTDEQLTQELASSRWRREGDWIVRDWKLADFRSAMAFVGRVAEAAEAADHHPDIVVHGWNRVRLSLTTHSVGAITDNDVRLARTIDELED